MFVDIFFINSPAKISSLDILSLARQPEAVQVLQSVCRHWAELTGSSMASATVSETADNPGFQDLKFKECVNVWIGG